MVALPAMDGPAIAGLPPGRGRLHPDRRARPRPRRRGRLRGRGRDELPDQAGRPRDPAGRRGGRAHRPPARRRDRRGALPPGAARQAPDRRGVASPAGGRRRRRRRGCGLRWTACGGPRTRSAAATSRPCSTRAMSTRARAAAALPRRRGRAAKGVARGADGARPVRLSAHRLTATALAGRRPSWAIRRAPH